MDQNRTIYRCSYVFKGELGPVRDSKAFNTEQMARSYGGDLANRGYLVVVWRELQFKIGKRWVTDFDSAMTQPLDS